jgi:hypothetical protein
MNKNIIFSGALLHSGFIVLNMEERVHIYDWHQEVGVEKLCDPNNWDTLITEKASELWSTMGRSGIRCLAPFIDD